MFDLFKKKNKKIAAIDHPTVTARIGRRGICAFCGSIKSGSFVQCNACGFQPINHDDLAQSLLLNENTLRDGFDLAVLEMQRGKIIKFGEDRYKSADAEIDDVRRMLALDSPRFKTRQQSEDLMRTAAQLLALSFPEIVKTDSAFFGSRVVSKQKSFAISAFFFLYEIKKHAHDEHEKVFIHKFFRNRVVFFINFHAMHTALGRDALEFNQRFLEDFEHLSTIVDFNEVGKYGIEEWLRVVGTAFVMNDNVAAIQALAKTERRSGIAPIVCSLLGKVSEYCRTVHG